MALKYILRLDDIAPNMHWENLSCLKSALKRTGVRPVAGVVPDNRDPYLLANPPCPTSFWDEIREMRDLGWEIAMHGYQHLPLTRDGGVLGLNDRSEFAGLPYEQQLDRLILGRRILEQHGLHTDVFIAPGHSFDASTIRALLESGDPTAARDGLCRLAARESSSYAAYERMLALDQEHVSRWIEWSARPKPRSCC